MPQAVHIESLDGFHEKSHWQRVKKWLSFNKLVIVRFSDQILDRAVGAMAKRRSTGTPAYYRHVNRHTWKRHSALIVARDEMVIESSPAVKLRVIEKPKMEKVIVKECVRISVDGFKAQPIWASACQDWSTIEVNDG